MSATTVSDAPAPGELGPEQGSRRLRLAPGARPQLIALIVAGVLLAVCWFVFDRSLTKSHEAREQARNLSIVSTRVDAIEDLSTLVATSESQEVGQLGLSGASRDFISIQRALEQLPGDAQVEHLREIAASLIPVSAGLLPALKRGDIAEFHRLTERSLQPRILALQRSANLLSAERLRHANRLEVVARIAGALALLAATLGIALVMVIVMRLSRRNVDEAARLSFEQRTNRRLDAIVKHATAAAMLIDEGGQITWLSKSDQFGPAGAAKVGLPFMDLVHAPDRKRAAETMRRLLQEPAAGRTAETQLRIKTEGTPRPVEVTAENRLADPDVQGIVVCMNDISERALLEDQLDRLVSRDPVTGVANRAQLELHLDSAIVRRAARGGFVGLLLLDIDDFRAVSDTLGHDAGDELLRVAARKLENATSERDLVARLDGDIFAVLIDNLTSISDGQRQATAILRALRGQASVSGGHAVDVDAHAGLAFGASALPARELIRHADIALLEAKAAGARDVVSFTDRMRNTVTERVALTGELRRGTERKEFEVDYQPIVDMMTGEAVAIEALARWSHPHRGRLNPSAFIDLAEQTGLIRPLGELVLRQACSDVAKLLEQNPDAVRYVSVNISPKQLEDADLTEVVLSALEDSGLPASKLMLELTERSIATEPERVISRLVELRRLGIRIALDDFGAGYSFLSFLEDYPLDALKIDRSLARNIAERDDAATLLRGIVEIGRNNDMSVIVEGVETIPQRDRAREIGIELAQGFLYSKPHPLELLKL